MSELMSVSELEIHGPKLVYSRTSDLGWVSGPDQDRKINEIWEQLGHVFVRSPKKYCVRIRVRPSLIYWPYKMSIELF